MPNISLTAPTEYSTEQAAIERRRKLAEAMQMQALQEKPTETAGGWAIQQSPLSHIGRLAQGLAGSKAQDRADEQTKALSAKYQSDLADTLNTAQRLGTGTPAASIGANEMGDEGYTKAAVAPDKQAMIRALMGHPGTQAIGMGAMQSDIAAQERKQKLADVLGMGAGGGAGAGATQSGGPFAGMPKEVIALMTSGDPELVALGKSLLEANKGIAQRPGAPVVNPYTGQVIAQPTPAVPPGVGLQVGPGGPQAYNVPGALGAMGAATQTQAGAQAAGALPFHPPTVVNTQGAPTLMTPQQQIEAATGQPVPQPGAGIQAVPPPQQPLVRGRPDQPGARAAAGPVPVTNPTGREASRAAILQSELENEQQQPPSPQRDQNVAQLRAELGKLAPAVPGLKLQDQGESAEQKSYGTERGQLLAAQPQAKAALESINISVNNAVKQVNDLANHPGLSHITGPMAGRTPNFSGAATDAQAKLDTLKAQVGTQVLTAMREASKTGGAVGAVTEREWPILQNQLGAIQQAQTTGEFKKGLQNVHETLERMRAVAQEKYNATYQQRRATDAAPAGWSIKAL